MSKILYLTDLYYRANGRNYYTEDLMVTSILKNHFDILIGHPHQVLSYMDAADLIVIRNTGSIIYYKDIFQEFVKSAKEQNLKTFNSLDGKGDLLGKQYLVELTRSGYPVIPTVDHVDQLDQLGDHDHYIIKLIDGADSIGMSKRAKNDVKIMSVDGKIIQPCIDFKQSYCVNDFIHDYNAYKGNAYGLANTLRQTAILKPKLINKKLNNLIYTGQLTVPGPGVPPSIISGKVAAQYLINQLKHQST